MLTSTARLLKLLTLLQTPREWTGRSLADALEVTPRTVRKDVERLRDLGYPVHGRPGAAGGYQLGAGTSLPPLLLDDEEAVAVAISLHAAATGSLTGVEEVSLRALTKITALLPPRLRRGVQTVQRTSVMLPATGPRVRAELLQSVAVAIRGREGVRFDYSNADGTRSRRRAEPYQLVHRAGRWYLLGYDLDRNDWRTFRMDRLTLKTPGGARFVPREIPGGDAGAYVDRAVRGAAEQVVAVVRLHAPVEEIRRWWQPTWGGELVALDEQHCRLTTSAGSYEQIVYGLAFSGLEFDVVEPEGLRSHLTAVAGRLGRAAAPPPPGT